MPHTHGRTLLETFKEFFSPLLYSSLEEPESLALIANNKIDLEKIKNENNCYTLSFLFNEFGFACLSKNHITVSDFLAVPKHERYTLHYLFKDGLEFLEKGIVSLKEFLLIPEKKRLGYIEKLKS